MAVEQLLGVVPYRCVCGNAIALVSDAPRSCLRCSRPVPAHVYELGDQTLVGDVSEVEIDTEPLVLVDQRLKHFQVVELLGQGGMGSVYRAVDESLHRDVALKVLSPQRGPASAETQKQQLRRLLEEARAQARICHPNVVQVYYVNHQDDRPFLALELVRGETLEQRLQREPLRFDEIINVARQTCQALRAAAALRIVHGDIKPANLLLSHEGDVKLSDFGLARCLEKTPQGKPVISGTPNYLSPEACRGRPTDERSDMYSLGVMLFEMTFGRLPYHQRGKHPLACLQAHLDHEADFPERWPEHLPARWKAVLVRLLSKAPENRYENYDELLAEFHELQPVSLPLAGRVLRGLAWGAELTVLTCGLQLLRCSGRGVLEGLLGIAAVILIAAVCARVGTSIGKLLFQLRLVDRHGGPVCQQRQFIRMLFTSLPVLALASLRFLAPCGLENWAWTVALVLCSISLTDAAFAVFRRDRRSFHDLLASSQVVLDTRTVPIEVRPSPPRTANPTVTLRGVPTEPARNWQTVALQVLRGTRTIRVGSSEEQQPVDAQPA